MTGPDDWKEHVLPRIADEADYIKKCFSELPPDERKDIAIVPANNGIGYMCAADEILVRDQHLERVLEILEQPTLRDLERDEPHRVPHVIDGVVRLGLGPPPPDDPAATVMRALELIEERFGRGIATPNHVLTVTPGEVSNCPATEPQEVYAGIEPYPSVCHDNGGSGVRIYMADTGLLDDAASHPWLTGVTGDPDAHQPTVMNGALTIPSYAGHGTFVAGVARCMAPAAEITVTNAFSVAGSALESDLVPRLEAALSHGVDIFHLTIACVSRHDLPLIAFREWLRRLREYGGAICIAAAGNSGTTRPTWPSAFSDVFSVGALGGDWRGRATFSNFGPWVDVYAPGRDLINAYATGEYECKVDPYKGDIRKFYGMAKWSGTSFSTPIVSGLIASRMSRTGENAEHATAALLGEARAQAIPGVGPVLLPCCRGPAPPPCCRGADPRPCYCGADRRPCCR